jgi:hypothetical protein
VWQRLRALWSWMMGEGRYSDHPCPRNKQHIAQLDWRDLSVTCAVCSEVFWPNYRAMVDRIPVKDEAA